MTTLVVGKMAQRMGAENLVVYHTEDYGADRRELMTAEVAGEYTGNIFVPEDMETIEL